MILKNNIKKISIIGSNSYIARNLIYVLNNRFPSIKKQLYDFQNEHFDNCANYHQIDIFSKESLSTIDYDCDLLFIFTGKTGTIDGFLNPDLFIDINEKSLLNILVECKNHKTRAKIVFPSTRLVYKGKNTPLEEESEKEFKTIYSINKFACENYLKQFKNLFDINYLVFRICVPYGSLVEGATSYGTCDFMIKKAHNGEKIYLYGNGEQKRTFTFIGDLCNVMIEGAFCDSCVNDVFNIGGEALSLFEVASFIDKYFHNGIAFVDWPKEQLLIESGDTIFSDKKIKSVIDCSYKMSFDCWLKQQFN